MSHPLALRLTQRICVTLSAVSAAKCRGRKSCWLLWRGGDQADAALDSAKADVIAVSRREVVRICIDEASAKDIAPSKELPSVSVKLNSA
jgi:hypothetical protein